MPALPLRSWVTDRISVPGSLSSTPLPAILEGIECIAQVLKDVQKLISTPVIYNMSAIGS